MCRARAHSSVCCKTLLANTLFEGPMRVRDDAGQGTPLQDLCAAAAAEKGKRGELSAANKARSLALPELISDMGLWESSAERRKVLAECL